MGDSPAGKRILVAPLDWGLGHAARCIPVIRLLLEKGHEVFIGGSGRSLALLHSEFPELRHLEIRGFSPALSPGRSQVGAMLRAIPHFIGSSLSEHRELKQLQKKYHFDLVISDHRYGLWNRKTHCILMLHQVRVRTPHRMAWAEQISVLVNRLLFMPFNTLWIPDLPSDPGLSGDLSHQVKLPSKARFTGPLSRFGKETSSHAQRDGILVLLSGPEPQRSILEEKILLSLSDTERKVTIVSGRTDMPKSLSHAENFRYLTYATSTELEQLIREAELVVCRPGYSTVMDLWRTGGKALFIPTPGQPEQEYLGWIYHEQGVAVTVSQDCPELTGRMDEALRCRGFEPHDTGNFLEIAIEEQGL